jgi:D-glycero-D-manno-heptose 1,7-bisphosphate phosphatase
LSRPAAILDRDGTLNVRPAEHGYVTGPEDFAWVPGAARGAARLAAAGFVLAVASNQRGVARGLVKPEVLSALEAVIQRELAGYGCSIEAFRYCLHDYEAGCDCRKPRSGLLHALADEFDLDLRRSWMIGDSESDILAGRAAGCRTALVGRAPGLSRADLVAPSLEAASELIVQEQDSEPQPAGEAASASNSSTSA